MSDERPHSGAVVEALSDDGKLHVVSTTMSQSEVDQTVGVEGKKEEPPQPAEREEHGDDADKSPTAAGAARQREIEARRPGRWHRRINNLNMKIVDRDAKIADLESRLAAATQPQEQAGTADARPASADARPADDHDAAFKERYADYDEVLQKGGHILIPPHIADEIAKSPFQREIIYEIAKNPAIAEELKGVPVEEGLRQVRATNQIFESIARNRNGNAAEPSRDVQRDVQQKRMGFIEKAKGSDFEKKITEAVKSGKRADYAIPEVALVAVVNSENPVEVANHLFDNADVRNELLTMARYGDDHGIFRKIQKIGHYLEVAANKPIVSRALPPIQPLGSGSTRSAVPLDEMDYQTFKSEREQQQRRRYR